MELSEGFPPVTCPDARLLVLGSLPGRTSINQQQYYAHPQNAFWPIMRELFGVRGDYARRCMELGNHGIALWDVLGASIRPGSMDADIELDSAVPNDFERFLREHADIALIAFNGRKAEQLFRRFVHLPCDSEIQLLGLPSTSPAYAAMPFSGKLDAWRTGLGLIAGN